MNCPALAHTHTRTQTCCQPVAIAKWPFVIASAPGPPAATTPASLGRCLHTARWHADILCNILWQRFVHFMALIDRPPEKFHRTPLNLDEPHCPSPKKRKNKKEISVLVPFRVALCLHLLCANTWQLSFLSPDISLTAVTLRASGERCNTHYESPDSRVGFQPGPTDSLLRAYQSVAITRPQREAQ